ncbi:MAG: hypothetical protein HOO96_32670 [Polyangiaceae bacterium]|nr:hypothetical protein [Polyangiaceae bacterium]
MRRLLLAALPFMCILHACTTDLSVGAARDDAGSSGADAIAPQTDGGTVTDGSTGEGGEAPDVVIPSDGGCGVVLPLDGPWIDVQIITGGQPFLMGGTITPGTYRLTAFRSYPTGQSGTAQVRETLVVTGSPTVGAFKLISEMRNTTGDFKAYAAKGSTSTYQGNVGSPQFFRHQDCPPKPGDDSVTFAASATELTLFDAYSSSERVYQRVP